MTTLPETRLNEILNKVFDYIDWFHALDNVQTEANKKRLLFQYPNTTVSVLLETRDKVSKYFDDVVDQPVYLTDDYLRLRKFIIYWFTSFNVLAREKFKISDINFIDKNLLLQSFGYYLYGEHNETQQKMLCVQLSDLYSTKGSPLCISQVFSSLNISNFTIFEYWLSRDAANDLVFDPVRIDDISFYSGFVMEPTPVKPYEAVTHADPHWYMTRNEIETAVSKGELGLPSLTPYIGIVSGNDWVRNSRIAMSYVNRVVSDQYDRFMNDENYSLDIDRKYYFMALARNISLLELYLLIGYIYNKHFSRNSDEFIRKNLDKRVPKFQGPENVLLSEVQFISEFGKVYKKTFDRDERKKLLEKSANDWHTVGPMVVWSQSELEAALDAVDKELKILADVKINANLSLDFLKDALSVFDFYIRHDTGLTNFSSLFMLFDPLQKNKDLVKKVFNFFKPYPTRLIEAVTFIIVNDKPGDCFAMSEVAKLRIKNLFVDWRILFEDDISTKITQKIGNRLAFNKLPFASIDPIHSALIFIMHMASISLKFKESMLLDSEHKEKIKNLFAVWCVLFEDNTSTKITQKIGDRLAFNNLPTADTTPSYTALMFIVNMMFILTKFKDDVCTILKHEHTVSIPKVDWYTLHKDKLKTYMYDLDEFDLRSHDWVYDDINGIFHYTLLQSVHGFTTTRLSVIMRSFDGFYIRPAYRITENNDIVVFSNVRYATRIIVFGNDTGFNGFNILINDWIFDNLSYNYMMNILNHRFVLSALNQDLNSQQISFKVAESVLTITTKEPFNGEIVFIPENPNLSFYEQDLVVSDWNKQNDIYVFEINASKHGFLNKDVYAYILKENIFADIQINRFTNLITIKSNSPLVDKLIVVSKI